MNCGQHIQKSGRTCPNPTNSREVMVAELPVKDSLFSGGQDGENLTYGFYCHTTNVFYECSSLEEYQTFQKLMFADQEASALDTQEPEGLEIESILDQLASLPEPSYQLRFLE